MNERKFSFWQKLKAYKLQNNVYAMGLLTLAVIASFLVYVSPISNTKVVPELMLAIATSLLATIFTLVADLYVKFKTYENDQLLEGIHEFGISDLHFNKQELLNKLLSTCEKELWISGYRLILTSKITPAICQAVKQGAHVKILVSPPWHEGFKLVYGTNERVIDNYCNLFNSIKKVSKELGKHVDEICEVRFTDKPLFNDTYKIDYHLVTGPYMHNKDEDDQRITANDFFTYNLIRKSRLYELVENEYLTLWDEATQRLDWQKYELAAEQIRVQDLREQEKIKLIYDASTIDEPLAIAK